MYDIQHCFICRPSGSTVSEGAGIEPRTDATTALAVKRSNLTTRLDLIHIFYLGIEGWDKARWMIVHQLYQHGENITQVLVLIKDQYKLF
jgi:hypothetical protein